MIKIVLVTGIFYLIQLLTPMILSLSKVSFLDFLSTSKEPINYSDVSKRAERALSNFKESLPFFLVMSVLSVVLSVDNTSLGQGWLLVRFIYFILAILNVYKFPFIRTPLWFVSIGILIAMGLNLLNAVA